MNAEVTEVSTSAVEEVLSGLGLESVMKAASELLELLEETLSALVLEEKITSAIMVALVEKVISTPETEEVTVAEPVEKAAESELTDVLVGITLEKLKLEEVTKLEPERATELVLEVIALETEMEPLKEATLELKLVEETTERGLDAAEEIVLTLEALLEETAVELELVEETIELEVELGATEVVLVLAALLGELLTAEKDDEVEIVSAAELDGEGEAELEEAKPEEAAELVEDLAAEVDEADDEADDLAVEETEEVEVVRVFTPAAEGID